MKSSDRIIAGSLLCLVLSCAASRAAEPTLARLGFWVPPERMDEFEATYEKQVAPILKRHALVASSERRPVTVDSIFTRAFKFKTPAEFVDVRSAILSDPAFEEIRRMLATAFGTSDSGGLIRLRFDIYRSSAGPGKQVAAGSGQGHWSTYGVPDGLAHNTVYSVVQDREGSLWFGTYGGGVMCYRLPAPAPPPVFIDAVVADRRYEQVSELVVPSTVGLTVFEFHGISFKTRPGAMIYRYRLNGYQTEWKTTRTGRVEYQDLPRGSYTFEVVAVDRDQVYSEVPATATLTVHLPYERIGWMSGLGIAIALVAWQTVRVIRRDRRLQESNAALSEANRDLFQANQALQQDRAVERIRAQVQTMEKASDFDAVLAVLAEDLRGVGLNFDTCEIDVLESSEDALEDDVPVSYFETKGFNYTTYTLDPDGNVSEESYRIPAPFPNVTREMIERFIAGQPWQGMSENKMIVEAPVSSYGRLRLTASDRDRFTDDEVEVLQDFAAAIALGYTRYLDFVNLETANQEIREQTERKSAFLASMSHELRTPMTAIKGYVDNMLDGITGALNERQQRNLTRVTQNSDNLLNLINDILDLSKIEAGRMDVNAEPFSVKQLISSCCTTVEPLVKPGVNLTYEVSDAVDEACTDEDKLRHVIGNLLSNAVKFTDDGEIGVRARTVHDQFIISVSDTGIGMPQEALSTIFDEFQQVKGAGREQKGTGLGLAITKQYTELLDGTISVESEVGKGTTFTVQIPTVYKEA